MVWPCRGNFLTAFLLVLVSALPASAADWPVPRGPSREPVPYRYDAQVWKKVPKEFLEDSPVCILYAGTTHLVEADGTIETITHDLTRFNGRKGIEKLGEYRNISYDPSYQKLTLNEARVHKADGRAVPIEPRHVQLRDQSTDYQVYDHDKQLVISFPSLEVGDVIEVKWTVRGKNPEYQGTFFTRYTFGDDHYPVVRDELRIRLPKDRTLKHAAVGGKLEPQVSEKDGLRTYHWYVTNRPQLPQEDNMPSREELRLQVSCSTFASWEEVGKWKQKVRANCWECTPEVRKVVQEVTKDLKTPVEKARALTYWVRRNIRYVSVGESHAYTPHTPATVLANRYGDCKDQSQLLAVMLREAGIPVALATLGVLGDGQVIESVPSPWGSHAILLVTLDGKDHWIDTTTSLAGWDFLPRDDRDRLCYVIPSPLPSPPRGEGEKTTPLAPRGRGVGGEGIRLVRTPPLTAELNRIEQATEVWVGADGSSRCYRTAAFHGLAALYQRDDWVEVPPGERRSLMTSELQDANNRTRLSQLNLDEKNLHNFDEPVRARIIFEVPGHFSGEPDREGSITDSKVWAKLLAHNLDFDRQTALQLWAPFESQHRSVIHLPPAYVFDSLPRDKEIRSKWGSFQLTVTADPKEPRWMELKFHTRLDKVRVEPADFEAFVRFHLEVSRYYRVWLTLKPTHNLDDAPNLEALLALAPEDSASAAVLARLYVRNDRHEDARRVLQRARHYKPNEAVLWELTVKAAETREDEEKAYRELIRRFPNESQYAVSLGTNLVDRGEYEQARAVLEPVLDKGSAQNRGQAHYQLARGLFQQNQPVKALDHLQAAGKADPDSVFNPDAFLFKGRLYEKLGQTKEAAEAYGRALSGSDVQAEEALPALIRLSLAANKRADALDYLRRYTVVVGDRFEGLVKAAELHLRLGRYDDAFELASRAREQRFHAGIQRVLGLVHLHRGDFDKAVFHLDKADLDAAVLEGLIRGHLALGNFPEAELRAAQIDKAAEPSESLCQAFALTIALGQRQLAVRKAVRIPPGQADLWETALNRFVCAEHAHNAGQPGVRDALLATCFADGVELGPAHALRGLLALEKGKLTKALADAERAVALCPDESRGYYVRGRVYLERGMKDALADLTRAAELSKRQDADVLHALAAALFRASRRDEALRTQRQAVKLRPNDSELTEQLREFEKAVGENQFNGGSANRRFCGSPCLLLSAFARPEMRLCPTASACPTAGISAQQAFV